MDPLKLSPIMGFSSTTSLGGQNSQYRLPI